MTVNLWSEAAHAQSYLENRARIPRRQEGYEVLLEFLPQAVTRVLDLGCGDGEVVGRVLEARPGVEAVAADFSAEMLGRVEARFAESERVTIVEHDLDAPLPPEWGTFDAVVSAFAIHHVTDERKRALYAEVYDRLRPGGAFLNLEHVASPTPELHEAFLATFGIAIGNDDPSNQLAPVDTQLAWLREIGFEQVDCHWKWRELALLAGIRTV
ncbi:MAG: class I SAM-dependent methyltransferase [Acidimicrobiia bacterium]